MSVKDRARKAFDTWENRTAERLERGLKSRAVLAPVGLLLTTSLRAKRRFDAMTSLWWSGVGLAGKGDQERVLFALARLESRMHDLEEKLDGRVGVKGEG